MKIDIYLAQKIINFLTKYKLFRQPEIDGDQYWDNLFVNNKFKYLFKLTEHMMIYLYKDSKLSRLIYDGFEKNEEMFIAHFLKSGEFFFDIGANIGIHSLLAAEKVGENGRVYSFEPSPVTYDRLNENIIYNEINNIVCAFQLGLSDKNEILNLNISSTGFDAWNSFVDLKHITFDKQISAEVTRFDTFVSQNEIELNRVTLIKIDVEGWELNVLRGIEPLMNSADFMACFLVEFTEENVFRAGYSCKELYNYMIDKGFSWFTYDLETNTMVSAPLKAYYPYENLIAIKQEHVQLVQDRLAMS